MQDPLREAFHALAKEHLLLNVQLIVGLADGRAIEGVGLQDVSARLQERRVNLLDHLQDPAVRCIQDRCNDLPSGCMLLLLLPVSSLPELQHDLDRITSTTYAALTPSLWKLLF